MSEYILETKNLGISFGGLKAVQDVNLKIKKNELYGLIGPNGAGKTTVFNMLTAYISRQPVLSCSTARISRENPPLT